MKRLLVGLALTLAGCGGPPAPKSDTPATATAAAAPAATPVTDTWVGRWKGPEGLFLDIRMAPSDKGRYAMTLKDNLDSQADYAGRAAGEVIHFDRGGTEQTIRAGTGAQTGFKDLAARTECLIVVPGKEGYCRD